MKLFIISLLVVIMVFPNSASAQKVGVVLSGGGAKGYAHVGLLKALEENHIPIDYICGTSIGHHSKGAMKGKAMPRQGGATI